LTLTVTAHASSAAIQTFDLTKTYGANRGIRDVNLTVERGEIFGFLGPNGAGKSTTLRTLLGFLRPTSGRAEVLGLDVSSQAVDIHRQVGNLPSEFSLEDRMTGDQLLRFYTDLRASGGSSLARAKELADRLDANLQVPMRRLSRGNKQKIGIIQALFHEPALIVLDEPTSGLDPLVQEEFLTILQEARGRGQTVFFSSHILSDVEQIADRVGIIRSGELIAVEDPHALTSRASRYVRIQFVQPLDAESTQHFAALPGIERFEVHDATLTFTVSGSMNDVIQLAGRHPVRTFDAERPPLEEIFLSYYGNGRE
jgi:ABC-2 type transport system ATP-binding protein